MAYQNTFSLFNHDGQRKYLNQAERKRFYEVADKAARRDVRLFCLLLFYTGARISEICNLTKCGIDFSNKTVTLRTLKRRRNNVFRQIPLPDTLLNELEVYISQLDIHMKQREGGLWQFSTRSASRYIKTTMQNAGIEGIKSSALGLRHGFAVNAVSKVPITQVQKWLGHAYLQTTAIYLNVSGEEERRLAMRLW